jgi:hypothetical protein
VRLRRLDRLAKESERHATLQTALARVDEVARRADAALGAGTAELAGTPAASTGPTTELAERTEAVLGAYRELRGSITA